MCFPRASGFRSRAFSVIVRVAVSRRPFGLGISSGSAAESGSAAPAQTGALSRHRISTGIVSFVVIGAPRPLNTKGPK